MRDTPTAPGGDQWPVMNVQYPAVQGDGAQMTEIYGNGLQGFGIEETRGFQGLGFPTDLIPGYQFPDILPSQLDNTQPYPTGGGAPRALVDLNGFQSQQQIAGWPLGADLSLLQAPLAAQTESPSWTLVPWALPMTPVPVVSAGDARATASLSPPSPSPAPRGHPCGDCGDRVRPFSSRKDLLRHCRSKHWPYSYQCWCGSTTQRKDNHHRHMKKCATTTTTVTSVMQCGSCGEETNQVAVHRAHVQSCGDGKKGRPAKQRRTDAALGLHLRSRGWDI
ncbi:hypothetical protein MAPG_07250 [Magnaporthiopsis poae ATCC 64411]|uniref:Uncharacterized protein n=1 Tax=Magnaporthiopsis poae (strain ATCC 64411 / 73-15) TaxID=644358 RepID=A0A0C4E461_MAGP6|nr:hypothetical protein MAPG_07250 [Magnaporthiopsis poae ATCC 64411]